MVMSGHNTGEASSVSYNDAGLEVIEILADFQLRPRGGNGWLVLLKFLPAKNQMEEGHRGAPTHCTGPILAETPLMSRTP